ncbi:Serpin domain, partial [Dillenia turbinata]
MTEQILMKEAHTGLNSNWIFSPLSLQLMLCLIASGARGLTLVQMLSSMCVENVAELCSLSSKIVSVASSGKTEDMQRHFRCRVHRSRLQNTEEINSWAKNATKGVIKNLIPHEVIDSETLAVLVNAFYFNATWKEFDQSTTQEQPFYFLDGKVLPVPFLSRSPYAEHFYGSSTDGFKILKIPHQMNDGDSRQFASYFFLPDKVDGLFELVHRINSKPEFLTQEFGLQKVEINPLRIPKFKISYGFEASERQLGLALPFSNLAELTEMIEESKHGGGGEAQAKVSKVIHKSFFEVTEDKGRLAGWCGTFGESVPTFIADHPFLLMELFFLRIGELKLEIRRMNSI